MAGKWGPKKAAAGMGTAAFLMSVVAGYLRHLLVNWGVGVRSIAMALFHFVHGIIPVKYTSHDYWGFFPRKGGEELK